MSLKAGLKSGVTTRVFQFSSIGAAPQDLKYAGQKTYLKIGDRNRIREFTTLNRGTAEGGGVTRIGNDNLFMAYSHVAHDCIIENHVVLANGATLAGHVTIESSAILGGLSAVHQFCRIGCHTMISGGSMVAQDIPPYTVAQGDRARTVGLNLIGLKRSGFSEETTRGIKKAYRMIYRSGLRLEEALHQITEEVEQSPELTTSSTSSRTANGVLPDELTIAGLLWNKELAQDLSDQCMFRRGANCLPRLNCFQSDSKSYALNL